jgi:hypothetical protein
MRHFAKRLTVYERRANTPSETEIPPAFQVCERLRANPGTFMGNAGFRELMSCTLPRSQAEIPAYWRAAKEAGATTTPFDIPQ